jgi:UDP-N-acetylmuramoyl-tripeptide--D-alanyl-D-alanine ligase
MIAWDAHRVAAAAGASVLRAGAGGGPSRATIDSRALRPGELFVGLRGEREDGGSYAAQALRAGAWGVMVAPEHARALVGEEAPRAAPSAADAQAEARGALVQAEDGPVHGAVLAHPDPLAGLQSLARAWRRALGEAGARVVAITGSTGKTSTKEILAALLRGARELAATGIRAVGPCPPASVGGLTAASGGNLNTEVGLPLAVLAAPAGTGALVLEMAMRGPGQIAQLTALAEPDVGVIVNVGPAHLEQVGSLEAVAAAKAELLVGMAPGTTAVVPAGESLLAPHLRADLHTVTFGEGGDVELLERRAGGEVAIVDHRAGGERILLRPSFAQSHNLRNLLAAVAAARALGVTPAGRLEVDLPPLRGERVALADGIVLINDCYNANPMSMRAALDDLAASAPGRRVAVLGDMLELGAQERRLHREVGAHARACGVELLVAVGPRAAEMREEIEGSVAVHLTADAREAATLLGGLLRAGDVVLVKGSRGMGLELVAQRLAAGVEAGARVGDLRQTGGREAGDVHRAGDAHMAGGAHKAGDT